MYPKGASQTNAHADTSPAPLLMPGNHIVGLILAGGRSSRFGGIDKGLSEYQGQAMVAGLSACFSERGLPVLISANRHLGRYRHFGRVLCDPPGLHQRGPLAGILSGMLAARRAGHSWLICVPVDSPRMTSQCLLRMQPEADSAHAAVAAVSGVWQPLHLRLHTSLSGDLCRFLQDNWGRQASMFAWLNQLATLETIACDDLADQFSNINQPVPSPD